MKLTYKGKSCTHQVFVIHNLQNNLLGMPAIKELEITSINAIEQSIPEQYPALFSGLGTFKEEYTIKLKPDARLFFYLHQETYHFLYKKSQTRATTYGKLRVISRVSEPTPWCAAMAMVPKPSGSFHTCINLKPLNKGVMREVHPLPKVDINLAQLTGVKLFSKLDTISGFWQVPLAMEFRLLSTFL